MVDNKWSVRKKEHLKNKAKSCQSRRTNTDVESTFQYMLWNTSKATERPITKIINYQQDIQSRKVYFRRTQRSTDKNKMQKAADIEEITPEIWMTREFVELLRRFFNVVYYQNTTEKWTEGSISSYPKKGDLRMTNNYSGKGL